MTTPSDLTRRAVIAGAVTLTTELAVAVLWPAPPQEEHDASALIGDPAAPVLRMAALGDSTLTGPGVDTPDSIWARVVARRLARQLGHAVDLRSYGVGGSTARDVARDQVPEAAAFRPHLSLVSVGANDVIRGVPVRVLRRHLDAVVGTLVSSGSEVVTSGVGDLGTIPRLAPPLRQIVSRLGRRADDAHAAVARSHGVVKADQWAWAAREFGTRSDVWSADRFHPNAAGHQIWADVCWEALEPLLPVLDRR